jgi:hypothetical protein
MMQKLIQLLISCEALLRGVRERFWANKIREVLSKSENGLDLYLLEEILSWYGSMGSINDLIISKHNDHTIDLKDENELNDELSRLRNQIYQEALRLKKK